MLVQEAVNGLPAMRFDGGNDMVGFSTPLAAMRTVFWVVREEVGDGWLPAAALGDEQSVVFRGGNGAPGTIWHTARRAR